MHQVLINGKWQDSHSSGTFQAANPETTDTLEDAFPISNWEDVDAALTAASEAFVQLREMPGDRIAAFLETYADGIEADSERIRSTANRETGLPFDSRLVGELARTTGQLRQAAAAARNQTWRHPTIDTDNNIRSCRGPLGPVAVFGPNNFPLAFGSVSGGDFVAAIAAGNPVIAKANPMHPLTTCFLAEAAASAADAAGLPAGTVQLIYHMEYDDGERMIRDPRLASVGFTGSRRGGLALKKVADEVGKPIYLELSSVNPIVILPGVIAERAEEVAEELTGSCVMGGGQFCTNPGLVIVHSGELSEKLIALTAAKMQAAPVGTLFSQSGQIALADSVNRLKLAGAKLICGGEPNVNDGFSYSNTVLQVDGAQFLEHPAELQTEAFGASTLFVVVDSTDQAAEVIQQLEGNLTGCFYSSADGSDDAAYDRLAPLLRQRVGRLINDKMPTGVAVSPAMNHGGPFPATGHPGFTAVGLPAAIDRFTMLQCYDNVRPHRLPAVLQDPAMKGVVRLIDGHWTDRAVNESA